MSNTLPSLAVITRNIPTADNDSERHRGRQSRRGRDGGGGGRRQQARGRRRIRRRQHPWSWPRALAATVADTAAAHKMPK